MNAGSPRSVGIPGTVLYRTVNSTVIWTNLNHPSQPTPLKRTHTRAQPRDEPVADRPRPGRTDPGLDARVSTNYCILYSIVYLFVSGPVRACVLSVVEIWIEAGVSEPDCEPVE